MQLQTTIATSVSIEGQGLHTGSSARLTFSPAAADSGILFRRVDLPGKPEIPAHWSEVSAVTRGTSLGKNGAVVHTVEHVLAALHGLGIDNVIIEIHGEEPPACDGSAREFTTLLQKAGIENLNRPVLFLQLREPCWLEDKGKFIGYTPADDFRITFTLEYPGSAIPRQTRQVCFENETFVRDVAFARTFGFMNEYEMLKNHGLARGGSLDNAVVIGDDGKVLNPGGVRHEQEFVLHKILDLVGDLTLSGRRVKGHVMAYKSGHALNVKFAKMLSERFAEQEERKQGSMMNIEQIQAILPHRYPFLLVDKILSLDPGKTAVGIKNVTANEEFFQGHFPGKPVMPGVLICEAMAQVAGVLFLSQPEHKGKTPFFVGIDKVRFRRPVVPGDRLELSVKVLKVRGNTGKVEVEAKVDSELAASGEFMFTIL